jgi:hypothetical protein
VVEQLPAVDARQDEVEPRLGLEPPLERDDERRGDLGEESRECRVYVTSPFSAIWIGAREETKKETYMRLADRLECADAPLVQLYTFDERATSDGFEQIKRVDC